MADVILAYYRTPRNLCTGFIEYQQVDQRFVVPVADMDFHKMITELYKVLKDHPDDRCVFRRLERPDLQDFVLDDQFTNLIRTDPLTAVKMMTFEAASVPKKEVDRQATLIVAQDALAETFGDLVYIRRRVIPTCVQVECPFCSSWAESSHRGMDCGNCGSKVDLHDSSFDWSGVKVVDLLENGAVSLYLPRHWNRSEDKWISREALDEKYEGFKKERDNVRPSEG
jgi:hypothetical protein